METNDYVNFLLKDFGSRMKLIRLNKKITQQELGDICNMEKASISKIEAGKINISYLTMMRLSKGLEIDINELIL